MGQQQLLLIILGVIIVGIAVVVGINMFTAQAKESQRDELLNRINVIAEIAMAYNKKPVALGGGGGSFLGFSAPSNLIGNRIDVGRINVNVRANRVRVNARGTDIGDDGANVIRYRADIRMSGITLTKFN